LLAVCSHLTLQIVAERKFSPAQSHLPHQRFLTY
jgi:hypothetical protein